MPLKSHSRTIRIGLVADEPIRMAGLASIFEEPVQDGNPQFVPVTGSVSELLAAGGPSYIMVDLHASPGIETLVAIHRARPDVRLIVIGPRDDDELVISAIIAGARAYLDLTADPEVVRNAVQVVTSGSIWAPRRLLSKLIDRLLGVPRDRSLSALPKLTVRERQVMELLLQARSNKEIAEKLGIEERTVKFYVGRLMRKAGADNRIKLSMSALGQSLFKRENAGKKLTADQEDMVN